MTEITTLKYANQAKSDQLNADDLMGGPITITITKVKVLLKPEQPVTVNYEGDNGKPWKPSKGMTRVMSACWGEDTTVYPGKKVTLFRNPDVLWAGKKDGGIQISHLSDIKEPMTIALTISKGNRKPFTVKPLTASAKTTPAATETAAADPLVLQAGKDAAAQGAAAYTAWKDALTAPQKESIRPYHVEWAKTANKVDKDKSEPEEQPKTDHGITDI